MTTRSTVSPLVVAALLMLAAMVEARQLQQDRPELGEGKQSARIKSIKPSSDVPLPQIDVYPGPFDQNADNENCISTPAEFLEVFLKPKDADRNRCVDPSIIVRLAPGRAPSSGDTLAGSLNFAVGRLGQRPISFWAFKDAAEKYLRIGKPQAVGSYVNGFPSNEGQNAPYLNSLYPSIKERSTGIHLLEQIGYPSKDYSVDILYTMIVGTRPPSSSLNSFVPTWENVRVYFEQYIQKRFPNEAFNIPQEVVSGGGGFAGLANLDFAHLTNCPAQCTFEDRAYPDLTKEQGELSTALVPAVVSNHTQFMPNICQDPVVIIKVPVTLPNGTVTTRDRNIGRALIDTRRLVPGAPTAIAETDWGCNALWSKYYIRGDYVPTKQAPYPTWNPKTWVFDIEFPGFFEICNKQGAAALEQALVKYMKAATSIEEKAIIFRAYLMTGCAGNFNPLFSGNGFTFTGTGGLFAGTVHEVLLGRIGNNDTEAQNAVLHNQLLGNVTYTFFCLDGSNVCCPTNEPTCQMK